VAQPAYLLTLYGWRFRKDNVIARHKPRRSSARCCGRDSINGSVFLRRENPHCEYLSRTMIFKPELLGLLVTSLAMSCVGQDDHDHDEDQMPLDYVRFPYQATYPGDGSGRCSAHQSSRTHSEYFTMLFVPVTADAIFSGIITFARLPWVQCLTKEKDVPFDIAFLGAPFVSP
jgi:hypothetical protein